MKNQRLKSKMKKYAQISIRDLKKRDLKRSLLEEGLRKSSRNEFTSEGILVNIARVKMYPMIPKGWGVDIFSDKIEDSARIYNAIIKKSREKLRGTYITQGFDEDFRTYLKNLEVQK
jgi:hypothetical protein